ncbi:FHA domain-containing protein [Blastopirellula sp. JC732]|uniref:histidine kinase n=1 Tax=Blastopirellula sediminis TaxID=2894196 RepID=A0A9X1MK12_9BACT|nr:ATP-binding protein [Blastopirellula sediminis]MCC9609014.1 FHA domain-containing protein [Blastopirellula sediminis]MCC9628209.1 FHA domain-containing protein [Blastopirellula sediminis]
MPSLFVIQGNDQGRRFELNDAVVTIGRDRTNTIQLHDTEISRRHAEIRMDGPRYELVDLESSNGCYINNEMITRSYLTSGDRVQLGRTLMIFTHAETASEVREAQRDPLVRQDMVSDGSRIIRTVHHSEGSQIFMLPSAGGATGEWFNAARANLQLMYHTALAVSRTLDIDQLLDYIMGLVFDWIDADRGCVMLLDEESLHFTPKARRFRPGRKGADEAIVISRTILDFVLEKREGVLTTNASDDDRWDPAGSIITQGVREAICVPMQGRYGIVGAIYLDTFTAPGDVAMQKKRRFNDDHLKLMVAVAHQAALAVEDTNYYSAVVQSERLAAVGQAVAAISHHVKNILQGIRGGSYLVEEGIKGADVGLIEKGWGIVERNQERISTLVMDMLSYSKEREPDLSAANINDTVGDVVELMQARAAEFGVELHYSPLPQDIQLMFDVEGLHRAVLNVVSNAIDATQSVDGAKVDVSVSLDEQAQRLNIDVVDNGCGIPPEKMEAIFTAFESSKGNRGTGLGLPVSQKILREHGGDIVVESQPGAGSRFTLYFPAHVAVATPPPILDRPTQLE